jgi:hypothetical protein
MDVQIHVFLTSKLAGGITINIIIIKITIITQRVEEDRPAVIIIID